MTYVSLTQCSSFNAAHSHSGTLNEGLHFHTFHYEVSFYGPLNEEGYLIDFRHVAAVLRREIDAYFNGQNLSTLFQFPTTENICIFIYNTLAQKLPYIKSVKLCEATDRWITYQGDC